MAGMHPEDIKAAIRKTGITLTELSLQHGLGESNVRQALFFQHNPAGELAIIKHLGIHPHKLWPNRYDEDGNRIIGRTQINPIESGDIGHRQKSGAA